MKKIIIDTFAIEVNDLLNICSLLKKKDIICTIYSSNEFDQYDLFRYTELLNDKSNSFIAFFDTNIVIDLLRICKGEKLIINENLSDTKVTSCALLILLQCLDIQIDPGLGIHEIAHNDDYVNGQNNLNFFNAINNLHPAILNNLLQGKLNVITDMLAVQNSNIINKVNPYEWHYWFLIYTCVLKIVILEKSKKDNYCKLIEYINWMWNEFIFCAAPTVFAIIYFSKYKLSKMLKNISSNNFDELHKIIKNVSWDLCAVEYWSLETFENHSNSKYILFCTQDKMLKEISKHIVISRKNIEDIENYNHNLFIQYWGKTEGDNLFKHYNELFTKLDTQEREKRLDDNKEAFSNYYKKLEIELNEMCKSCQ